jgi:hypothetical protein
MILWPSPRPDSSQNDKPMKPTLLLTTLLLPHLVGCSSSSLQSTGSNTTREELIAAYQRPDIHPKQIKVSCSVVTDGRSEQLPTIQVRPGQTANASVLTNHRYPADYTLPQLKDPCVQNYNGAFPITPSTPSKSKSAKIGLSLEFTASVRKGFIMLSGTLTKHSVGTMVRAGGLPFRPIVTPGKSLFGRSVPIVLTENKALSPSFETLTIPILIAAQAGETNRINLNDSGTHYLEFTCESQP